MTFDIGRGRGNHEGLAANVENVGTPGKRGHTDGLEAPAGATAPAGTGGARGSSLVGTSWLSGVLGFGDGSAETGSGEVADEVSGEGDDGAIGEAKADENADGKTEGKGGGKPTEPKLEVTHYTKELAPGNNDDRRRTVGIGEVVELESTLEGEWTASVGTPSGKGAAFTWTAPSKAGTATITFVAGKKTVKKTFTVIAPSSLKLKKLNEVGFPKGTAGALMRLRLTVGPATVSFGNVEWLEKDGPASEAKGHYKDDLGKLYHRPNPYWTQWNANNTGIVDQAGFGPPNTDRPWGDGGWTWVIPNLYQVKGTTDSVHFATTYQVFTLTKDGVATVTKGLSPGAGEKVTRAPG